MLDETQGSEEESEDIEDAYPPEEKLFNRTVSQMSEHSCRPKRKF